MNKVALLTIALLFPGSQFLQARQAEPWENPLVNGIDRLPARATSYSYATETEALAGDRTKARIQLLNGVWKFHFSEEATNRLQGFQSEGFDPSGWADLPVPSCWKMQGYGYPIYTNIIYPFPFDPPFITRDNPVGSYVRDFTLPAAWKEMRILLHFGGGSLFGLQRVGQRSAGRLFRGQLPACRIRYYGYCPSGQQPSGRRSLQVDGRQLS